MDLGDWFSFEVPPSSGEAFGVPGVSRYNIRALLDGRLFEAFHVDVGVGDPFVGTVFDFSRPWGENSKNRLNKYS